MYYESLTCMIYNSKMYTNQNKNIKILIHENFHIKFANNIFHSYMELLLHIYMYY